MLTNVIGASPHPNVACQWPQDIAAGTTTYSWNALGNPTEIAGPNGVVTHLAYDPTGQDVLTVDAGKTQPLARLATLTYQNHLPETLKGADGYATSMTYNARGQANSVQRPDGSTTVVTYYETAGPGFGKPQTLTTTYPGSGTRTVSQEFAYDAFHRIASITDLNDQYSIGIEYDAIGGVPTNSLDRITKITYPDATFEKVDYLLLDASDVYDRAGRQTHYERDAMRRVQSVTDPLNRTITYQRLACCGTVDALVDANNHTTEWKYDVRDRVIEKKIGNTVVATYAYHPASGRLVSITDALRQTKQFGYTAAGDLGSISYVRALNFTPGVSFEYDDPLGRMTKMTDGTGDSVYSYWPVAAVGQTALGGGRLKEITRPGAANPAGDTIHLDYDVMGRVYRRSLGGAANVETLTLDMGRVAGVTNNLGAFSYSYEGETDRLAAVNYPNGQQTSYAYWPAAQDFRLQQIKNLGVPPAPGAAAETLSQFDYDYDQAGRITTWAQRDSDRPAGRVWTFGYDAVDQLTSGSLQDLATYGILKTLGYQYDFAGNRTQLSEDGTDKPIAVNENNQALNGNPGGWVEVRGEMSQAAYMVIDGREVEILDSFEAGDGSYANHYHAMVQAHPGQNNYRVSSRELNPPLNTKPQTFNRTLRIDIPETGITSYDANGNLVNNGTGQIYAWDAENRLVTIYYTGTNRKTVFGYDGLSRRVRTEEWEGYQITEGHTSLWYGSSVAEERGLDGTVLRRHFGQGVQEVSGPNAGNYYYTSDHLGSIREMTDASGVVRARYDYDPYGNRTKVSGDLDASRGFTGFHLHRSSGLELSLYRAYDSETGRWLSRDPIAESGGLNLYEYCLNDPLGRVDPLGLDCTGDSILDDPVVRAAIKKIWADSQYIPGKPVPFVPEKLFRSGEVGDKEIGIFVTGSAAKGYAAGPGITSGKPMSNDAYTIAPVPAGAVAGMHTHPDSGLADPSVGDANVAKRRGIPEYMIGKTEIGRVLPSGVVDKFNRKLLDTPCEKK